MMTKTKMTESIKSLYQASHQAEFLHLQEQTESLIQELQALKQDQLTAGASGDRQMQSDSINRSGVDQ